MEEECVLISRRGSSVSGVGGHTLLGGGVHFDVEEGSTSSEVGSHTLLLDD